jgi:hypothetical protein
MADLSPLCVDVREAARMLGVSVWTVREYVAAGELPTVKLPATKGSETGSVHRDQHHVTELIAAANNVKGTFRVVGGPPWVDSDRFDVHHRDRLEESEVCLRSSVADASPPCAQS